MDRFLTFPGHGNLHELRPVVFERMYLFLNVKVNQNKGRAIHGTAVSFQQAIVRVSAVHLKSRQFKIGTDSETGLAGPRQDLAHPATPRPLERET